MNESSHDKNEDQLFWNDSDDTQEQNDHPISVESGITNVQKGAFYIQYQPGKDLTEEESRERLVAKLERWRDQRNDFFVDEDEDEDILSAVEHVIIPNDIVRSFFISNCSNSERRCKNRTCPLNLEENERGTKCPLAKNECSHVILRPVCNLPSMETMFPGNEILAVKAFVKFCPVENNGSVLAILDFVWVPKCEKRPYEVEISAKVIRDRTNAWESRPNNVIKQKLVSHLPPISMITKKNLDDWRAYLEWRTQLIRMSKSGIRYLSWEIEQIDSDMVVSFTIIAPSQEVLNRNSFWRRETVFAYPLNKSSDQWEFRDDNSSGKGWQRFVELGDFYANRPLDTQRVSDCPWPRPYLAKLSFWPPDEAREALDDQLNEETGDDTDFDVVSYLKSRIDIPDSGFLSQSYIGDESLIRRMERTLDDFARNGSNNSPFLSTFLFDIGKARLPQTRYSISNYLNQNLNDNQRQTIETMINAPDIALIQGPPGTGKTTVIAEAVYQFVLQGKKVLLSSQSIAAVDNALDRLENIPEIRAIRLKKKTKYSRDYDDNSRYSVDDALQNFYETLGIKTRNRLAVYQQLENNLKLLDRYIPVLENYQERISMETELIRKNRDKIPDLQKKYDEAQEANRKNEAVKQQKQAMSEWLDYVSSAISRTGETLDQFDQTEHIPAKCFSEFESCLLPLFVHYSQVGVNFLVTPWDPDWTPIEKMSVIQSILRDYDSFGQCIDLVSKDLARFKDLTSDKIISLEDSMQIEQMLKQEDELLQQSDQAFDEGNTELHDALQKQYFKVRKARRDLEAKAAFPAEKYKPFFRGANSKGIIVMDFITNPKRTKQEMISFFTEMYSFLQKQEKAISAATERFKQNINDVIVSLVFSKDSASKCAQYRVQLENADKAVQEAQDRLNGQMEECNNILKEAARVFSCEFNSLEHAIAWCTESRKVLRKQLDDTEHQRSFFKPIWDEWLAALQVVTPTDKKIVFNTYLRNCSVVGITCTADNSVLTDNGFDSFDVVIVDEVSKATPPELLLPLLMGGKIILVGDHRQLPPLFGDREPSTMEEIVQRQEEENVPEALRITKENFKKYKKMVEASLFKNSFEAADDQLKFSLLTQYRMHPDIMRIINEFYENKLQCGLKNSDLDRAHDLNIRKIPYLQKERHAYWIDSTTDPTDNFFEEDQYENGSKSNYLELQLILKTLQDIDLSLEGQVYPDGSRDEKGKLRAGKQITKNVAVIAFYGKQKILLKKEINRRHFKNIRCKTETVDRFQGQERDFVLVSMTRNKHNAGIKSSNAFVAQFERINVAFSRARELLLVFGAKSMFYNYEISLPPLDTKGPPKKAQVYRRIIDSLDRNGCLIRSNQILSKEAWRELLPRKQKKQTRYNKYSADNGKKWTGGRGKK